jgi:hypothetical protein
VGTPASASNLVISEMMYAPASPDVAEQLVSADPSDFEWIELMNVENEVVQLADVRFEAGIDFSFTGGNFATLAPGARMLVVRNQAAFEARYGTSLSTFIAGEFGPTRLDNAGERIHLVNALGSTIQDFTYGDSFPWPGEAGFPGYSLALVQGQNATPDHGDPTNWRSSGFLGGSPVGTDQTILEGDPMADLDEDGIVSLVEHALGTSDADGGEGGTAIDVGVQSFTVNDITNDFFCDLFPAKDHCG